jgi:hypothetical protein
MINYCISLIGGVMKKVYIISTCIKKNKSISIFHFKGFYAGKRITMIKVLSSNFELNQEYLIKLVDPYVEEQVLFGRVQKSKILFE